MAKGTLLTMSSLTGSIGGLSFRADQGGSVMYAKAGVKGTSTPKQSQRNMWVAYYASAWRALTPGQRDRFRQHTYAGKSGYSLFMYCNLNRSAINNFPVAMYQKPVSFPQLYNVGGTNVIGGMVRVSFTVSPSPATGYVLQMMCTPPVSPGISVPKKSLYRLIQISTAPASGSINITTFYTNIFGRPPASVGDKMFIRVRLVHIVSGYASPWVSGLTLIT